MGFQLTLFQPRGADYAHCITACPPRFENVTTCLPPIVVLSYRHYRYSTILTQDYLINLTYLYVSSEKIQPCVPFDMIESKKLTWPFDIQKKNQI